MKHGHSASKPNGQALGYARVSTDEQAREGVSLEAQVARIRAYAQAKELELRDVLTDDGISGKTLERPALRELVQRCEQGEVGHVVVVKLDRITRSTRDLLALVDDLFLARNIELHSVAESLDTSTPHGRFVLTLFGGLAQMERELVGERTRSALAYKRQLLQPTSHAPYGFRSDGARARMRPLPDELATVRRILHHWRAGISYARIARELNADGVPTKLGGRWHASTVRGIVLRVPFYEEAIASL